jgi:hypothetical protein
MSTEAILKLMLKPYRRYGKKSTETVVFRVILQKVRQVDERFLNPRCANAS